MKKIIRIGLLAVISTVKLSVQLIQVHSILQVQTLQVQLLLQQQE